VTRDVDLMKLINLNFIHLLQILSALLLAITLFTHGYFHEDEQIENVLPELQVMYATSLITILLVTTGLYGVCKRKKWMLICYIVGMTLCSMLLGVLGIHGATGRPKVIQDIKAHYLGVIPFSNANLQCCGMYQGYQDWGYNISEACLCVEDAVHPCSLRQAPVQLMIYEVIPCTLLQHYCSSESKCNYTRVHTEQHFTLIGNTLL
uniref:Uncharacterized protein n=1 Tax=Periophthalmus magnuspinnatus TaxID=409849 RepID=A0A3B3ZWY5_9GOBI